MWSHHWTSNTPIRCLHFQAILFYKVLCHRGSFQVKSSCLLKREQGAFTSSGSILSQRSQWEWKIRYIEALNGWRAVIPTLLSACCSPRSPLPYVPLRTLVSFQVLLYRVHCGVTGPREEASFLPWSFLGWFFRRVTHFNKVHVQPRKQCLPSHLYTFTKLCFSHIYQLTEEATGFLKNLKQHTQEWTWGCEEGEQCRLLEERQACFCRLQVSRFVLPLFSQK